MSLKKIIRKNIEDSAVTEPKIANEAVTAEKLGTDFITGLTELTSVADNDNLMIYDASAGALKKVSKVNTTGLTSPTFSSVSPDNSQTVDGGNITFTITGTGFTTGTNARLIGASGQRLNFSSVTRSSTTSITAVIARSSLLQAQSPYGVQVINGEGLSVTAASQITVDNIPVFNTSAGSLGTFTEGESIDVEVSAYDPDSTSDITFELQSGSLPAGLSLVNQSGDSCRIQGTASEVSADTTSNFTLRATDSASNTTSRSFSITIEDFALDGLRFDDGSSDYLTKTFGSDGTSHDIGTVSVWLKRSELSAEQGIFTAGSSGRNFIRFESGDTLTFRSVTDSFQLTTTQVFRDPSAWYHIVISYDTTQATASNRVKFYVNGSQITSFGTETYPSQNLDIKLGAAELNVIGRDSEQTNPYYDGYMSEFIYIDGQQLTPTSFGETDSNGVWIPKVISGLTFGTNGFHLDFADSANLGNDVSGNNNDFTENNITSIDKVEDSPQNNYATMNPIASQGGSTTGPSGVTFENGNLDVGNITSETAIANLGVDTGKWYWEVKVLTDQDGLTIGAVNQDFHLDAELAYNSPTSPSSAKVFGYYGGNGNKVTTVGDGSQFSAYGSSIAVNDIVGVAMNLDDNEVTFYLNGSSQGTFSITALGSGEVYFPAVGNWSVATITTAFNFGNPTFSISSGNSDENGYGNFEYSVPTGYYALNTKNLAQYG